MEIYSFEQVIEIVRGHGKKALTYMGKCLNYDKKTLNDYYFLLVKVSAYFYNSQLSSINKQGQGSRVKNNDPKLGPKKRVRSYISL